MSIDQIVIRTPNPEEMRAASSVMRTALMLTQIGDDDWEKWGGGWTDGYVPVAAFDGDRCVGHAGTFQFDTMVPGGTWVPTAGLTRVGVLPTHHRRGILTRMLHQLLGIEREAGKVITSLRASEALIYGRFGYGLAGEANAVVVDVAKVRPIAGAGPGTFRLLRPDEMAATLPAIYERANHRVGAITLDGWMWKRILDETIRGTEAGHVVVHTSPDFIDDGFAHYTVKWLEGQFADIGGTCKVHEVFASSPEVELAMWTFLCDIGLVRTLEIDSRPVDDLLRLVVRDYRGYQVKQRWDEQWVRLLDVPGALSSRTYHDRAGVTIAVSDPWFPENEGTYRISGDGVARAEGDAELVAPIASISAAYLGGTAWVDLLAVGKVQGSPEAARRADDLFRQHPLPWCGNHF
jgi:predicted acetyltransferase